MAHVGAVANGVTNARLELGVRRLDALAQLSTQHLERIDVRSARLGLFFRVRDLGGAKLERCHPDVIETLVIHILDRNADVTAGVVMMDVPHGLETGREAA